MDATCRERITEHFDGRLEDLELFYCFGFSDTDHIDPDDLDDDGKRDLEAIKEISQFNEYGLEFAWREPGTFEDQGAGYYEYLLSTGGPADMFRFHGDGRIEYRLHDWGDGAGLDVTAELVVKEMARYFQECEMMPKFDGLVVY